MVEWWNEQTAGIVGGLVGAAAGILGGVGGTLMGVLAPRGKAKWLVIGLMGTTAALGVISLLAAITAGALGQPYHVCYPLTLIGLIMATLGTVLTVVARRIYRAAEMRKLDAEQIRRGT